MKDLIQEGRKIQETFNKRMLTENMDPDYVKQVQDAYYELANKVRKIGKFEFDLYKVDGEVADAAHYGSTKSRGNLGVYFKPFENYITGKIGTKFEVNVIWSSEDTGTEKQLKEFSKYAKNISSSGDPRKDAKMAFDYIKTILMTPEIKALLQK
jgi:hypothetical protein